MINYELLEAINANKIMKKEEKIKKALLLIEQLTNKKPVLKEEKVEPVTKQVVEEAAKIVSKDVLAPKVVRDGLLKETVEKPIKRRFYAVTDDFEKQAKRLIAFYNDMLTLHPELKSEASKIKRALGSIEQTFTNTEMFINENKQGEQLELDFENNAATNSNYKIQENTDMTLVEEMGSSDPSFENWKKALHLYDTSSLESDINRHQSNGIKPTEEQDKALTQLFRGSKVSSRFIMRSDFGRWKTAATLANYNKDCKDFGKQKVDDLVNKVLNIYTPLLQEDVFYPEKPKKRNFGENIDLFIQKYVADAFGNDPGGEPAGRGTTYNGESIRIVSIHNPEYCPTPSEESKKVMKEELRELAGDLIEALATEFGLTYELYSTGWNSFTLWLSERDMKRIALTEDIAGMTTASMAVFDSGLGIKPASKKKT